MKIANAFIAAFACIALPCTAQINKTWVADTASVATSMPFLGTYVGRDGQTRSIYFEHNGNRVAFTPIAVWLETDTRLDAFPDSSGQIFSIVEAVMEGMEAQDEEAIKLKRKLGLAEAHIRFLKSVIDVGIEENGNLLKRIARYEMLFGVLKD